MRDRYAMAQLFSSIPTPAMRNLSIWTIKWSACYATASDASLELAESISNASNATAIMVAVRATIRLLIFMTCLLSTLPRPLFMAFHESVSQLWLRWALQTVHLQ